jgi:hypothetical protein
MVTPNENYSLEEYFERLNSHLTILLKASPLSQIIRKRNLEDTISRIR